MLINHARHSVISLAALLLALGVVTAFPQLPPDKSGVKPSAISLPSGAGSIEGLGESFEPQLNSGGSTYGISIALPPGRAGLAPSVRLQYNSNTGNGVAGIGWSLDFLSIKRQTDKGLPEYNSGDTFLFRGEELVPLNNTDQDWRCENERSFERLRQIHADQDGLPDAWEITERNGTKHTLGKYRGQDNRWSVVENPDKSAAPPLDRTYCWMLDSTTDLQGNRIEYEYTPGTGVLYPSRITYSELAGALHEVLFAYEDRPDAIDDFRPTFPSRQDKRLKRIEVRSLGQLVRTYRFDYEYATGDLTPELAAAQATYLDLGVTLLKRVVQTDRTGSDANFLPPLLFFYSGLDLTNAQRRTFATPPELDLAEPNGRVQLVDLDGDGLPDLFSTSMGGAGLVQQACLNRGETNASGSLQVAFAPARQVMGSSPVDLAQSETVVHDPKGKGLVDMSNLAQDGFNRLLTTFGNRSRLDLVSEDRLGFSAENLERVLLQNPPTYVSYNLARARVADINFDKRGDFLFLEPQAGVMKAHFYYVARDGRWQEGVSSLPATYSTVNTFANESGQPNPNVHLADMNGDRMMDLVCLTSEATPSGHRIQISYWPLSGLGRFADEHQMSAAPGDSFDIGNADLRDVFIEDFTGDGLADVLVLENTGSETTMTLRVNIAGNHWSPPYRRSGLPRFAPRDPSNPTTFRLADINASGSVDLIFRNLAPQSTWDYVELLPAGKPNLLTCIDNSLGKRTTIVYGSAAEDEQWARQNGHPWRTFAPIALQVVRQIRVSCGLDLNSDGAEDVAVSEFRYRDPFYDGIEREFRGFAYAQRVDYGDDFLFDPVTGLMDASSGWDSSRTPTGQVSGPSLVTRFRFLTGAADQTDNDDYNREIPARPLIDEVTEAGGREEEVLKGLQVVEEKVDPVVLHSIPDGGFDAGCETASFAATPEGRGSLTTNTFVYTRAYQDWAIKRLYRPAEPLPYLADQNADGILEDYRDAPIEMVPAGRFAAQGIAVMPGNGRSVSFAFVRTQVTEVHEANGLLASALGYPERPFLQTRRAYEYDDYGNQTALRDYGIEGGSGDDERFTTTTYALGGNALPLWVINKPDSIAVTDENGVFVSKREFHYDGDPFLGVQGQIQDRALLSRSVEYFTSSRTISATRSKFDTYGNVIESLDPVGNLRRIAWDSLFQTFPVQEEVVVGGALPNLIASAAYDHGFGVITSSTNFNGIVTSYLYDSFGRLAKIAEPGDTEALPTTTYEYQPVDTIRQQAFAYNTAGDLTLQDVPAGSASRVTTRQREIAGQPGEFITASFADGCKRALATIEEGETAGQWIVRKATSYNLRQQPRSAWLPYTVSSTDVPQFAALWPAGRPPASDEANPAIVATDTYYDPTGREIRTVLPPETWGGPRRETLTQQLPFEKRLFDEEDTRDGSPHQGTSHVQYSDGLNRLIAVEEIVKLTDTGVSGPLATWRTEYQYDLNDQLIRIKDSQGNIKTMAFDGLKRMTAMNDPDRGSMSYEYDDASNLRQTVDAKNQKIVYTYDGANRIKTEDYQDGGPKLFDVQYFYDVPQTSLDRGDGTTGSASNTKGQLGYVRDLSGETHFSYDSRQRIAWELKRVPDPIHGQLVSYRTQYAYDSADRLQKIIYPDGDEARHDYNSRSLLSHIYGAALGDVVANTTYRPSGQLAGIRYGNHVQTHYAYDPRLRLTHLETTNSSGTPLIDFAYTLDGASNIERIDDQRPTSLIPASDPRRNTQVFQYDSLYRLTQAQYNPTLNSQQSTINYKYDRIGNMLQQSSDITHMENGLPVVNLGQMDSGGSSGRWNRAGRAPADPPGPHALSQICNPQSQITNRLYSYDANGNMLNIDGLTNTWDFKDRLVRVENTNMVAEYTYDYIDRRIIKRLDYKPGSGAAITNNESRITILYLNKYFEIRENDALVKYIWNGSTRVARVTASIGTTNQVQHLRLQSGWNLVCLKVGGKFPVLDPANNADIAAAACWTEAAPGNGLVDIKGTTALSAGSTAWIYAQHATTVMLIGSPPSAQLPELTGRSQFVGNPTSEPINVDAAFPPSAWVAQFDTASGGWLHRFPTGLLPSGGSTNTLLPGQAVWVSGTPGTLSLPGGQAMQVRFYLQDHLQSTAVVVDQDGTLIEEYANYPFGYPRCEYPTRGVKECYQFTQKEEDVETGLNYFEKRFQAANLGRFVSSDALSCAVDLRIQIEPQRLNAYAYCLNRPLISIDPTGMSDTSVSQQAPAPESASDQNSSQNTSDASSSTPPLTQDRVEKAMSKTFEDKDGLSYEEGGRCSGYTTDYAKQLGVKDATKTEALRRKLDDDPHFKLEKNPAKCDIPGSIATWKRGSSMHGEVVTGKGPVSSDDKREALQTQGCRDPGDSQKANPGCGNAAFRIDWLNKKTERDSFRCYVPQTIGKTQ